MLKTCLKSVSAAAVICGGMLAAVSVPTSAATVSHPLRPAGPAMSEAATMTETVNHRRYDRHRHGHRYRYHRRGYDHYHDGWWYRTPFWALTAPFVATTHNRHVRWCENRYRSYNRYRDAYRGYDGRWHRCNSPYD